MKNNTPSELWWQSLTNDARSLLITKYGFEEIEKMFLSEHPSTAIKEEGNGEFILLLNEGADDEQKLSLAKYINAFDEYLESDFMQVVNLLVGQSCQYGADHIKRIS